jgi:bla regulator protein blaR1
METLAGQLSGGPFGNAIDRIVIDRTGLSGTYDLSLSFSPSGLPPGPKGLDLGGPQAGVNAGPGPVSADTDSQVLLPTALQEQLALKLEPQTGPVDVLVIDHVEEPSPN